MPSDELFVETDPLFASVDALRRSFQGAEPAEGLAPVALSSASASETLTTVIGLAAALPASLGTQLELAARNITLGGLRVLAADDPDDEGP